MYWDYKERVRQDETREEKIMRLCRLIHTGRYKVPLEVVAAAVFARVRTDDRARRRGPNGKPPVSH